LLLGALVLSIARPPVPAEPPPMQVELYSTIFSLRHRQPPPRAVPEARPREIAPSPLPSPTPETIRPQGPTNRPRPAGVPEERPLAEVTPFYRRHIEGCGKEDLNLLPPAEREKCQVKIAAQDIIDNGNMKAEDRNARPILRLDPDRRAEFDRELGRRRARAANNDPIKPCDGPTVGLGSACLNHDKPE
jgi:hypothetical protein